MRKMLALEAQRNYMPFSGSLKWSLAEQTFIVPPSQNHITIRRKEALKCNSRTTGLWKKNDGGNGAEEELLAYGGSQQNELLIQMDTGGQQ